jgi:hypothetical protein
MRDDGLRCSDQPDVFALADDRRRVVSRADQADQGRAVTAMQLVSLPHAYNRQII